jgi:hypothetical protein
MKKYLLNVQLQVVQFFKSPFGMQILVYSFFYAFLWSFHLVLISLTSFFHLLLDHNIRVIGDWITDRGWTLIILSKVVVFYLVSLFYKLKSQKVALLEAYLRNSIQSPRLEFVVVLLFMMLAVLSVGSVQINKTMIIEIPRLLFSSIGTVVFYGIDFFLVVTLSAFYPLYDESKRLLRSFVFAILFYLYSSFTFIYEQNISINLFLFFFILVYLSEWRRHNWSLPLLFLSFFIFPFYTLLGQDPVWGEVYSPFLLSKKMTTLSSVLICFIAIAYLHYKEKKYPEYIYRD